MGEAISRRKAKLDWKKVKPKSPKMLKDVKTDAISPHDSSGRKGFLKDANKEPS